MSLNRRLTIPPQIADADGAYELLSAWVHSGNKISSMSRTGTPLDQRPEIWGQVLAALANNIALSAESHGFDRAEMLKKMKASLDQQWEQLGPLPGHYYPPSAWFEPLISPSITHERATAVESNDPSFGPEPSHRVRHVSPPQDVPVYNCLVLVAPRNEAGTIVARAANLAGLCAEGQSERETLQKLVPAFKAALAAFREQGEAIPWLDPPDAPQPGETQRWIAVHL